MWELVGDDFIINPTYAEIAEGDLDLVVAGTPDGVIMVEAGASQVPEDDVIEAIDFGYEVVSDIIEAQNEVNERIRDRKSGVNTARIRSGARELYGEESV